MNQAFHGARAAQRSALSTAILLALGSLAGTPVQAADLNPGGDWQIRWDNTLKHSSGLRLNSPNPAVASANTDDGTRSFNRGLMSNRLDLLSEFDVQKDGLGLRLSAAAWYDMLYQRGNEHDSPRTANRVSVPWNRFTPGTQDIAGGKVEMLDWFVFGKVDIGDKPLTARLGQHSLIWGTSLFFGMNGLAKGMAPIDLYKLSIPGAQAKETTMPVPQLSSALQLSDDTSIEAYVQFKYKPTRLHPSGSFLSATDMLGPGAERMFIGDPLLGGHRCGTPQRPPVNCYLDYRGIHEGAQKRNLGIALNTRSELLGADLGFYAISYRDTSTIIETNPAAGTYRLVVPRDPVRAIGMSFAKLVGVANVGIELSVRDRQPLAVKEAVVTAADPSYVTGRTAHLNVSTTMVLGKSGWYDGASLVGEFAANNVLGHEDVRTRIAGRWGPPGAEKLNRERNNTGMGMRVIFTPTWYQVASGLDLSVPVNLGWSFKGRSMIDTAFPFSGSPDHGGELVLGLSGVYLSRWHINLSWVNYLGKADTQALLDRDHLRLSIQTTF